MAVWHDLVSLYKDRDLAGLFSSLEISEIAASRFSNLKIASLAQWILESGRGTSTLATKHFNFAGLKWRDEMQDFATAVLYDASDGPDRYCKFAGLEEFVKGYWKFITRSPYTGWEDETSSAEEYIQFLQSRGYAEDVNYVNKVVNLFPEARQLLELPQEGEITPTGTWIKETDAAIYWMQGEHYIDKADKITDGDESSVVITDLNEWFSGHEYPIPQMMKIAHGEVPEPPPKPPTAPGRTGRNIPGADRTPVPHRPRISRFIQSPNHNKGRSGQTIDTIVLHNTEGAFAGAISHFQNRDSEVSAHYLISRQGEIVQMVKDDDTAWHARSFNSRSIGIEHEATRTRKGFTSDMEQASIALVKYLMHTYKISLGRVLPHRHDWGGSTATTCPNLVWGSQQKFNAWKEQNLQSRIDSDSREQPLTPLVKILQPSDGEEFQVNQPFTVAGEADDTVHTVNVYTPWGGTNWALGTSIPVIDGRWSIRLSKGFNTGGEREILAEGNGVEGNSLDFSPAEVRIAISTGMTKPTRGGRISSRFGMRGGRMHNGIDIAVNRGVPVFAVADGSVSIVRSGCREGNKRCGGGFGNHIFIKHATLGLTTVYAHLSVVSVSNGQGVTRGQRIGSIGSTGHSTGPHLHFEIRQNGVPKNPLDFINPIV